MEIALICQPVHPVPAIRGGAIEIYIDGIVPYLGKENKVTVYSISDPLLPEREENGPVTHIRFPKKHFDRMLEKDLATRTFDVVHLFNRPKAVARLKKRLPSSRFIVSVHGEKFHEKRMSSQQVRECAKHADAILTVSDYIRKTVIRRDPSLANKTHTLYAGAATERFVPPWIKEGKKMRESLRKKLGLAGKTVILFTGQLTPKKGAHILLQAMERIAKKHPDARLLVVGSSEYGSNREDSYVQRLKKLAAKLKGRITFTGFVPPAQVPPYFAAADLFVCASQWQEPVARVHYEAMAAGLPIVTTARGGNGEVIRHQKNGLVIADYRNPKAFARAINALLKNPGKARRYAEQARRDAERYYNWRRVSAELLRYYSAERRQPQ
ncbi:spore coat protein CotSA [Bacillaceae bacterium]